MTYLAGTMVLAVDAGAPNNGRGDQNIGRVKAARIDGRTHPYVSAQAFRRWLRDTMAEHGAQPSPVEKQGKAQGKNQKGTTAADPIRYTDDDIFGYMKAGPKGKKDEEAGTTVRDSPFMLGTLMAIEPVRITSDFGTMSRGDGDPILHEHEFYTAQLTAPFLLDLPRIGTFTLPGTAGADRANYLSEQSALQVAAALQIGATPETFRGQKAVRLPIHHRRDRAAALLEAFATVSGGAKRALHYGDRTPAITMLLPMAGGINPLGFAIGRNDDGAGWQVHPEVLADELHAWAGEWQAPLRIGWRPGFRNDLRRHLTDGLAEHITSGTVVIDHPRTLFRALAAEIRDGHHDDWFDDPKTATA